MSSSLFKTCESGTISEKQTVTFKSPKIICFYYAYASVYSGSDFAGYSIAVRGGSFGSFTDRIGFSVSISTNGLSITASTGNGNMGTSGCYIAFGT